MDWLKRLFAKASQPETIEPKSEFSGKEIDQIALRVAKQMKPPEIRLDRIPPDVLEEIARRAASYVTLPPPATQELSTHVIDQIARRASEMIKVPDAPEIAVNLEQLPPRVLDGIARRAVAHLSAKVLQDIGWEVVPELSELLIRKYMAEGRLLAPATPNGSKTSPIKHTESVPQAVVSPMPAEPSTPGPAKMDSLQSSVSPVVEVAVAQLIPSPEIRSNGGHGTSLRQESSEIGHSKLQVPIPEETSTRPTTIEQPTPVRSRRPEAELPVVVGSEEDKPFHYDARRYAKLLVAELKLYNEQKVKDGRENGNLYTLLREEIVKSQEAYSLRVKPPVAAQYDYFHDELVKGLAQGDRAKLGVDYPGAN